MAISSEFHAYTYIKNELNLLGWIVANPTKKDDGEVYTQNECLQNPVIKAALGNAKPENVVVVRNNKYWVIEAKPEQKNIEKAIREAQEYAEALNKNHVYAPLISGVAGNDEENYLVKSFYFHKGEWKPVEANGRIMTGFLPKEIAHYFVDNDTYKTEDFNLPDDLYYAKAKTINEKLHIGAINKNNRAKVMSALLLTKLDDVPLNRDNVASVLIGEINLKVKKVLHEHSKVEFAPYVQITNPPTPDNHVKFRKALLDTLSELDALNIKSAMNSGTDILGRFYEVFLKYGNGAKEIGIVLTPRHLTRFGVEVLGVSRFDIVFDPACGTGGFLVAAFDYVKKSANEAQVNEFKESNIFGFEQEPEVVALALVNMIFRGDGKNNIVEGNGLTKRIPKLATKVLMNPPFALKKDDEKEYRFVNKALEQMEDNGLMFVILPSTIMFKGKLFKAWREQLLAENTLEAVIKLPDDLFYPVAVHTSAVIIRKGVPHDKKGNVFFGYLNDGYVKKKGVMKRTNGGNMNEIKSAVKDFLNKSPNLVRSNPKVFIQAPILFDTDLECAPEYYLEENKHGLAEIITEMRAVFGSLFNFLLNNPHLDYDLNAWKGEGEKCTTEAFAELFDIVNAKSKNIEDYAAGTLPFVTSTELNNGVEKYIETEDESTILRVPCVVISSFGFATVQIPPFVARSHGAVIVLKPKKKMRLVDLCYFAALLNLQKWRFSYGRWVTKKRLLKLSIEPVGTKDLPELSDFMEKVDGKYNLTRRILYK